MIFNSPGCCKRHPLFSLACLLPSLTQEYFLLKVKTQAREDSSEEPASALPSPCPGWRRAQSQRPPGVSRRAPQTPQGSGMGTGYIEAYIPFLSLPHHITTNRVTKTTEIYSLSVLEAGSLKSKGQLGCSLRRL